MATVLPWARESPVVALGLILAFAAYVIFVSWGYQALRRALLGSGDQPGRFARFLPEHVARTLASGAFWTVAIGTTYLALYALTWVWEPLSDLAFRPAVAALPEVLKLAVIFLGARLALDALASIGRYADRGSTRRIRMSPQVVHVLERFFRYVVFLSAGIATSFVVLSLLGYSQDAEGALIDWLRNQAGSLLLLAALVGIGWAGGRIIRALTSEMRYTSKRFSPAVIDALGTVGRGALFTVLGLVGIITVLNAVGQGAVGGTLVVVLTSFIGLTVAMAGTGSIGNALSGAVIVAFRPYERGDRVVLLDDVVCDVEEISLMFTKVRTLAREVVEVPNNQVLSKRIVNLTRSGPHAMVVKLGIGYDVSHALVRKLATEAALATEGVLKDPPPKLYARSMGSFAIEYELYAYTRNPRHLEPRSDLLGKLQESFYGAGVEIMTPDMHVVRRGKTAEAEGFVRVAVDAPLRPGEPRAVDE